MKANKFEMEALRQLSEIANLSSEAVIVVGAENDAIHLVKIIANPDYEKQHYDGSCFENPKVYSVKLFSYEILPDEVVHKIEGRTFKAAGEALEFAKKQADIVNNGLDVVLKKLS